MIFLVPLVIVVLLSLPLVSIYKGITTGKKAKYAVILNLSAFFGICALAVAFPVGGLVSAATDPTVAAEASAGMSAGLGYLAAALVTGLSAIGAGIAVAAAAPAAIGACSEDPKAFGKSLIFVALGEGVAIYGLLISILILNKI